MHRNILLWGIGYAFVAVLLGAFGAHALKAFLTPEKLLSYETGVRYQFIHALALIAMAIYVQLNESKFGAMKGIVWASNFFIIGTVLFSGSIYGLAFLSLTQSNWSVLLGPITPIGGLCFMLGWVSWARVVWLNKVDM